MNHKSLQLEELPNPGATPQHLAGSDKTNSSIKCILRLVTYYKINYYYYYYYIGGAVVQRIRHLGLRSVGRGSNPARGNAALTTLGKLFTPMCLCHQAV